ncbi:MAG: riboflavin biosynthesis protein RibD [Rhizobiaceae bacterium MnEN-MB40S]|nr:MAG: riboflavin biosynthesis protein RibD [Rhizobiaceae bacterium MnEN-MB40S]
MNRPAVSSKASDFDRRMMAAAIRYSYRHLGRTGTNPSVATLIVRDTERGPVIVGRGVTAIGGRPHAETEALAEAGELARGATAYVTLEPCAHHGSTPPCANALVAAGIKRVVAATTDPDHRVSGKGYAILRDAGVEVLTDVLKADADFAMAGYLMQRNKNRAHVTLKMALSADGKIGRKGAGQVAITGEESRAATHILRAVSDVILIGVETALADDPELTCRLPGLQSRSPARLVLDSRLRLPFSSRLVQSAATTPVIVATTASPDSVDYRALSDAGCQMMACEPADDGVALAELLDDLAGRGYFTVMVEGGARVARSFLKAGLVDRIVLYTGSDEIGPDGVDAPLDADDTPDGFRLADTLSYGRDVCRIYERV